MDTTTEPRTAVSAQVAETRRALLRLRDRDRIWSFTVADDRVEPDDPRGSVFRFTLPAVGQPS